MNHDELDRLAAEHILGWGHRTPEYVNNGIRDGKRWQPTRNITQAFELMTKFDKKYWLIKHHPFPNYPKAKSFMCSIGMGNHYDIHESGETASEAIVRACLRAKGVDV